MKLDDLQLESSIDEISAEVSSPLDFIYLKVATCYALRPFPEQDFLCEFLAVTKKYHRDFLSCILACGFAKCLRIKNLLVTNSLQDIASQYIGGECRRTLHDCEYDNTFVATYLLFEFR